jgi:RNase H-fold protein (predicted Holliday junction resolvase)
VAEDMVVAIDPGREKCGLAVVHKEQGIICKTIIATPGLAVAAANLAATYKLTTVIIGSSTTSATARAELDAIHVNGHKLTLIPVNEYRSTDEARKRYWRDNPPQGLKRLIPTTLQVPPVPVDDYAAVILAERYFANQL